MTILTKPSIIIKKPDGTKSPLVLDNCVCDDEKGEVADIYPSEEWQTRPNKRMPGGLLCITIIALLVAIMGVTSGLMLYRQFLRSTTMHRYQGFCSIPIDTKDLQDAHDQLIEQNYQEHRVMPLRWSSTPDDVQVFSTGDEEASDDAVSALREEFEIGDRVEKIRVFDNGKTISFIHDFDDNVTGIVDTDRCFLMDLDPELVLSPDLFVFGIERGEDFDITRIRSTLHAMLPALQELTRQARLLADKCFDKPTYRLQKEEGVMIRKRAADAPSHDYIQFSGKHVQEIEIGNLAELLTYEQSRAQGQA